jgi:hypothetical protein
MIPAFSLDHWEVIAASALIAFTVVASVFTVVCVVTMVLTKEEGHAAAGVPKIAGAGVEAKKPVAPPAVPMPPVMAG